MSKKEKIKKIFKIKKILNSLLLSKKEKLVKIKKLINKPKKDVYKPIKINGAFSDNFVEYKSDSKKDKSISIARYLNNIREHLRKLINDKRSIGNWKIQLIMKINFISSKNFIDTRDMHSKSDNSEIMSGLILMKLLKTFLILFYKDIKKV